MSLRQKQHTRSRRTELKRVDVRPTLLHVPGQEVFTTDGLVIRVSAVLRVAVTDPVAYLTAAQEPIQEVYLAAQVAIREAVAELTLEAALGSRATLPDRLRVAVEPAGARVGLEVVELVLRDIMLPGELRRAYSETALVRERAKADLERARGEAATLRSLANTAKLLEEHPALLQLRTLQTAAERPTTLVLAAPGALLGREAHA